MKTILQAFLLAVCLACIAHSCCVPKQWEGLQYGAGVNRRTSSAHVSDCQDTDHISYDALNKRFARYGQYTKDGDSHERWIISDYAKKTQYYILPGSRFCNTSTLDTDFIQVCIKGVINETYFGGPTNTLEVNLYKHVIDTDNEKVTSYITVTKDKCYPVTEDIWGRKNNILLFQNFNYLGTTAGIADESVFTPPDYCSEPVFHHIDESHRKHSILKF